MTVSTPKPVVKREKKYNPTVTVCSRCLRACCWQGEFMCDDARYAKTVERKIDKLVELDMGEHPFWWNRDLYVKNEKLLIPEDLIALGVTDKNLLDLEDEEVKDSNP